MKDTINKDNRRLRGLRNENHTYNAWKLSHNYSNLLLKHIDNENLYEMCVLYHFQYMNEIKNHNYKHDKQRNYIQVWDTMMNTVRKYNDTMKGSVRLLHQTSVQRIH